MASRNLKPSSVQGFDSANINDKMQSSTLKRQPSPDWSKADLLRLLSYFEGELQARDITIATLKAEKAKQLLYQAKYGRFGLGDPFVALQRDAEGKNDTGFDEAAIKSMYDNQLAQLENLIATQRKAQLKMREQLGNSEKRFHKVCTELEEEKQKHAQDTAQGDDVTYMLEKERERLKAEIDFEKSQNKKLEKDLKKTLASLEEERANAARHKQVAIMLIKERKNLIERIVAENQLRDEMESALTDGKSKIQNMAEGLAQESKKSLKMEAALDKQSSKFDSERESLRHRLQEEEKQTNILRAEVSRLSKQLEQVQVQLRSSTTSPSGMQARSTVSPARATNSASGRNTGIPGVVTMSSGSSPQSVSPSPNNTPPQGHSSQSSAPSAGGVRSASGLHPAHGTSKLYSAQSGNKLPDGGRIGSNSPEKEVIYRPEISSSAGSALQRGQGPGSIRIGPAGAPGMDRMEVDIGTGARVVNIPPGSGTTVTTHSGGKISFHVAGGSPQVPGQPQVRKPSFGPQASSPIGRGVPPPIPPNKPNFVSPVPGGTKPSPPPKVSVVGSSVLIQSPGQSLHTGHYSNTPGKTLGQQPQRAVQIPVTVVGGAPSTGNQPSPSGSVASVRTQVRETSPSAVRKTSQPLVDSPPLEHLSTTANVVSHPESSHSLEFLGPEMANLQKLLATMTRGETSEGNSHVTMSSAPEASSSSPLLLSSTSPHTPISRNDPSSPPSPNMNKIPPSQHAKDLQEQNNNTLKLVLDKQEMNVSTTVTAQLGAPISVPLHIYDERTTNTPNTYMSHNILSPTAVSPSFSTMTSSPIINQPAGWITQNQNVLINPLSLPTTVTSPSLRRKSIPSRSRSKSPTKALLHPSRSSSLHKVSAAHESSIPGSLGSSVFQPLTSPSPLNDRLPDVHQKSALGDVIALHQILTSSPTAVNLALKDGTTPLHTAVENEQEASLKVLLSYGASPNCLRDGDLTPLHIAAMKGYSGCLGLLLSVGAKVNLASATDQTPLHLAVKAGQLDCCQILLRYDADVLWTGQDGLTSIHYAVQHNHPDILKLLLDKLGLPSSPRDSDVGYQIVGITDKDGWTVAHMAAYLPKPDCLALLTENLPLDLDAKDKLGRSARAIASASCREALANLDQLVAPVMKVQVELRYILETKTVSNVQVGFMEISPGMGWRNLEHNLRATLDVYLAQLDAGLKTRRITRLEVDSEKGFTLGLTVANIKQFEMGFYKWTPGMQTDTAPYAMLTNNQYKRITIIVDDAGNMSELIAFDVLQPVTNINNYLRLLEQYKSVIFYGPAGSGKSYLAQRLAQSIAAQEMAQGRKPGIYQLSLEPGYSWASFLTFLKQKSCVVPINRGHENIAPILVLDNLEAVDIAQMFGELLDAMEYRGIKHAFFLRGNDPVENGMHYLTDQFYLIGTMNKSRSLGVDLSILPRFRWVQFRLDTEPLRGLLARHFLRRIFNTYHGQRPSPEDPVLRSVEWIVCVWQRLNDSLNKLGLLDVVLGPCMFFKCPLEKQDHELILEWMKTLWNQQIAPRVREAVKRGTGSESPTDGQQKVANTALYVLMQRSVMLGCPLVGQEKESYLKGFSGSNELSISLKPGDRSRVTSLTSPTSPRNSLLKHDPSSSLQSRRWRSDGDRSQTALVPSSAPEDKGRNGREERRPDNSLLASNIKRRSLSESSVNKAAQQEQEQRHIDNSQIPFSHHAKVAKLEVKSPKFVSIASAFRSPVLNHLQHQPDLEETPQPGPTVHKTGRVSPLLSLVTSSRNTGPNVSQKKSRSSENITTSGLYGGSSKPKSPFSFSLSTPRSSLSSFKFLDNVSSEGADRTLLTEQMPDFSVFDQVPTPTDERSQGFVFVKQAESKDTNSEKEDDVWSRRTHLLAPEQVGDNIRRENPRHKSVPS